VALESSTTQIACASILFIYSLVFLLDNKFVEGEKFMPGLFSVGLSSIEVP
jgi:hypothetical protein